MANVKIFAQHSEGLLPFYDFYQPALGRHGGNFANFEELNGNGDVFKITGKNLVYENGAIVDGTITSMTLFNSEGVKYCTMTNFKFDAEYLPSYMNYWAGVVAISVVNQGNDRLTGSLGNDAFDGAGGRDVILGLGGDDLVKGGTGADTLSGGGGADDFVFYVGDGRDRIIDFAPGVDHIIIDGSWEAKKANGGRDTLIEYQGGSVLLEDIRRSELQIGDID